MRTTSVWRLFSGQWPIASRLNGQTPYRVRAYRHAADVLLANEEDVATIAGRRGLEDIEGVGKDLAGKIREFHV